MKSFLLVVALVGALALPGTAPAKEDTDGQFGRLSPKERERMRDQIRQQRDRMSPEERQQQHDIWRERWQNLPPEERLHRREEMRERWEHLTPEQRERLREAIREHRAQGGGEHSPSFGRDGRR